jgi:hypothetical protein
MVQGLKKKSTNIPLPYSWFWRRFLGCFFSGFGLNATPALGCLTEGKIEFAAQQIRCTNNAKIIIALQKLTAKKMTQAGRRQVFNINCGAILTVPYVRICKLT